MFDIFDAECLPFNGQQFHLGILLVPNFSIVLNLSYEWSQARTIAIPEWPPTSGPSLQTDSNTCYLQGLWNLCFLKGCFLTNLLSSWKWQQAKHKLGEAKEKKLLIDWNTHNNRKSKCQTGSHLGRKWHCILNALHVFLYMLSSLSYKRFSNEEDPWSLQSFCVITRI